VLVPTKLTALNKVIVGIKKHKVWGTGVPSSARRVVKWQEYIDLLTATGHIFLTKHNAMI
jgi:hypothetical protein